MLNLLMLNRKSPRLLAMGLVLAFLPVVSGCGKDIVAEPLAAPLVDKRLMSAPADPNCGLPRAADGKPLEDYPAEQVDAARICEETARKALAARLAGLQKSVRVREAAVAKAMSASKSQ